MEIRCIALDLDRTTLDGDGYLPEENRKALEEVMEKGVQVVMASGRALSTLPAAIREMEGIRYAITSNGAAVYELHTGKCLKQYKMTEESVRRILTLTRNFPVTYEAFVEGEAYAPRAYVESPVQFGASVRAIPYIQGTRRPVEDIRAFICDHASVLDGMDVITGDRELKTRLWQLLNAEVRDVYITSSVAQLLEISYKDAGKHTGAAFLLDYLGLCREELAAFGDGDNDAELLAFAGIGIAMENASVKCKESADCITLSNEACGVAHGIRNILKL